LTPRAFSDRVPRDYRPPQQIFLNPPAEAVVGTSGAARQDGLYHQFGASAKKYYDVIRSEMTVQACFAKSIAKYRSFFPYLAVGFNSD
jgi:hypothetical protein